MAGNKLERRLFLKYCAATAVASNFMVQPLNLIANNTEKRKKTKFKLTKPRWIIYDNGSYDLISNEIILQNCRPAFDGQGVMPKNVFLGDSPKGKRIVYELPNGFLMLDLKTNKDSISIGAEFSGFSKAPRWFLPISQAEVLGVKHYFRQGYGTDGPSGIFPIHYHQKHAGQNIWTDDSYMNFGFMGQNETIAIGNIDHKNFYQRFSIYNRQHKAGIRGEQAGKDQVFFEAAMLLDQTRIDNEYIKLPELHFFTGNKPLETFRELAWRTSEKNEARKDSTTSYHWIASSATKNQDCCQMLNEQLAYVKKEKLPLHSFCIKNYCIEGDWLTPGKEWTGGLDNAAREIYKEGFRAGISLSPFRISDKSKIFKNHKDWIIKDNYGQISPEEAGNEENFYALDLSHPGVQKYISRVFKALRKMGFIFYETTHLHYGLKDSPLVKRQVSEKSNVQIFRDACQLIRTEIGPGSLWMADQTPYAPLIGFADIVKNCSTVGELPTKKIFQNIIRESWYSYHFNNIYWQNSPGEILLSQDTKFTAEERLSLMRWAAILGGAVGTSDNMAQWNTEQLEQFLFLEPSRRPQNAHLPFWPDLEKIKVAVRIYKSERSWGVLFLNDTNEEQKQTFDLFDLIEKEDAYVFAWDNSNFRLGKQSNINVSLLPNHSMLVYICENDEAPHPLLTLGGEKRNLL